MNANIAQGYSRIRREFRYPSFTDVMESETWLGAEDARLAFEDRRFRDQSVLVRDHRQVLAALHGIDLRGPPEFALTLGAEFQRLAIAFHRVLRAVHATLISDAVPDA